MKDIVKTVEKATTETITLTLRSDLVRKLDQLVKFKGGVTNRKHVMEQLLEYYIENNTVFQKYLETAPVVVKRRTKKQKEIAA